MPHPKPTSPLFGFVLGGALLAILAAFPLPTASAQAEDGGTTIPVVPGGGAMPQAGSEESVSAPSATTTPQTPTVGVELITDEEPDASAPPPGLTTYLGREVAMTMHWSAAGWLIRNRREREESTTEMREALALKDGMVVCDMGVGNGYHALPMAEMVGPTGKVIGVDVQPEMIALLFERAEKAGIANIEAIVGEYHTPNLQPDTIDLCVMVDVYHEFSHPVEMLRDIRASLREDGEIVLVEFRAEDETVPIKPEHKMSKAQILKEMTANGFTLTRSYEELPWQHMMFFGKSEHLPADLPITPPTNAPTE